MGTSNVRAFTGSEDRNLFTSQLLKELDILQDLIDTGVIESNVNRIGAELEIFIIDDNGNPNPIADKILDKLPDCFTSEYSDYIVELNLEPHLVKEGTFNSIKRELQSNLNLVAAMLEKYDSRYLLAGILPSFDTSHLSVDSMTQEKRYGLLHNFVHSLRNEKHETFIQGIDTLDEEDGLNVYGGALASYQMHLQVSPDNAVDMLNISQLITPPLLAIGVNSPLFMERGLWHETRVPLFEQSTDQRDLREKKLDLESRVSFGKGVQLASDNSGEIKAPLDGKIFMPLYQKQGNDGFFIVCAAGDPLEK